MRVRFARHRAFTLIEVLVVLVLAGIMMAMAVPNFQDIYRKRLFVQNVEEFRLFLLEARSMAIREKSEVIVCLLNASGTGCDSTDMWSDLSRNKKTIGIFQTTVASDGPVTGVLRRMSFSGIDRVHVVNWNNVNQPTTSHESADRLIPINLRSTMSPPGFRFDPSGKPFQKNHMYYENSYAARVAFNHHWGALQWYHVLLSMDNHACWSIFDVDFSGRYSSKFLSMARIDSASSLNIRPLSKC